MQPVTKPTLPALEGYLAKLKHHPSLLNAWSNRYFKINSKSETFEYYNTLEDVPKSPPTRAFDITDGNMVVFPLNDVMFQVMFKGDVEVVFILRASGADVKDKWVNSILKYLKDIEAYKLWILLQPMEKPVVPVFGGLLLKLKHKPGLFGSWNERYFKLNHKGAEKLEYYKANPIGTDNIDNNFTAQKSWDMNHISGVRIIDPYSFQLTITKPGSAEQTILTLRAKSIPEQINWVDVCKRFVSSRNDYIRRMNNKLPDTHPDPSAPSESTPTHTHAVPVVAVEYVEQHGHSEHVAKNA